MLHFRVLIALSLVTVLSLHKAFATDYFVNSATGSDANPGTNAKEPFLSIDKINTLPLQPGDRILFAAGQVFKGELRLMGVKGLSGKPIIVGSYPTGNKPQQEKILKTFTIDAKGKSNGIFIKDCNNIIVKHAIIEADGYETEKPGDEAMRVGVMIRASNGGICKNITIDSIEIKNIYFENKGFVRGADEVKTENGTQKYGWGIRLMTEGPMAEITQVTISNCKIKDVSHTGIKLTGSKQNIHWIEIHNNDVAFTGGPGIQMSEVKNIHVHHNKVDHTGSTNDSRKWGRGSGLWTWSASQVLIEHNSFTNANGPGDSAGAHIDFNCDHVVLQYNFSANNAGGFCEILGNNYNCAYRYNVSVNDGHRIKGENGAFQEGKIFWLSGYQGQKKPRKGPVNSYFYNNTIYVDASITARVAIDGTSNGILIANNIFYIKGDAKTVLGDQYKADDGKDALKGAVVFKNNLWLHKDNWPKDAGISDEAPIVGDPVFKKAGGMNIEDYVPTNQSLTKGKGVHIKTLPGDFLGLLQGMIPDKDILGNTIGSVPHLGAIVPK
jgi:hypothetical protein